jgi:hypothetical protein
MKIPEEDTLLHKKFERLAQLEHDEKQRKLDLFISCKVAAIKAIPDDLKESALLVFNLLFEYFGNLKALPQIDETPYPDELMAQFPSAFPPRENDSIQDWWLNRVKPQGMNDQCCFETRDSLLPTEKEQQGGRK